MKVAARALIALDAVIWAYLGYRIVSFPENHWGMDNRVLVPFFAIQCALAVLLLRRLPKALSLSLLLVSALSVAASSTLVSSNVLLPYELWLKRGMPARPF
jgi:hypothetical protein